MAGIQPGRDCSCRETAEKTIGCYYWQWQWRPLVVAVTGELNRVSPVATVRATTMNWYCVVDFNRWTDSDNKSAELELIVRQSLFSASATQYLHNGPTQLTYGWRFTYVNIEICSGEQLYILSYGRVLTVLEIAMMFLGATKRTTNIINMQQHSRPSTFNAIK